MFKNFHNRSNSLSHTLETVTENGNCRQIRQSPFSATVAEFGEKLSPKSATIVSRVDTGQALSVSVYSVHNNFLHLLSNLKSMYIYGSYRKIKTGITFLGPPGIIARPSVRLSVHHTGGSVKGG